MVLWANQRGILCKPIMPTNPTNSDNLDVIIKASIPRYLTVSGIFCCCTEIFTIIFKLFSYATLFSSPVHESKNTTVLGIIHPILRHCYFFNKRQGNSNAHESKRKTISILVIQNAIGHGLFTQFALLMLSKITN